MACFKTDEGPAAAGMQEKKGTGGTRVWLAIGALLAAISLGSMPVVSYDMVPEGASDEGSRPSGAQGPQGSLEAVLDESEPGSKELKDSRDHGTAEDDTTGDTAGDDGSGADEDGSPPEDKEEADREGPSPIPGLPSPGLDPGFCGLGVSFHFCATQSEPAESGPELDSGQDRRADDGSRFEPFARSRLVDPEGDGGHVKWAVGAGLLALLGAALVRGLGFLFAGRFLFPAGWRLDRQQVVSHPVRSVMLEHLEKHPGATVQELADAAAVRHTRAVYHLSILHREECVSQRRVEGRKHFFLASAPVVDPTQLRKRRLARSDRPPARVLECLARSPGATVSQVARMLGFSPGHAHYHLSRLEKKGLLDRLRRGRRVRHYLTREGHEIVAESQSQTMEMEGSPAGSPAAEAS